MAKRTRDIADDRAVGPGRGCIIRRLGYTPRGDRVWTPVEIRRLRRMVGTLPLKEIAARLNRPYDVVRRKARSFRKQSTRHRWTGPKVKLLGQLWTARSLEEVQVAFPQLKLSQIVSAARYYGFRRYGTGPLEPSGIPVIDDIKRQAASLGLSMHELDLRARSGTYFSAARWHASKKVNAEVIGRAVEALGGEVYASWEELS